MKKILSLTLSVIMILLVMMPCSTVYADNIYSVTYEAQFGQTEARKSLEMVNDFRTGADAWYWNSTDTEKIKVPGLSKLSYDYELEIGTMQRAAETAVMWSHTRPNGSRCFTAYNWVGSCGENIAVGYTTVEDVIEAWKETNCPYSGQGHRRNMLNSSFSGYAIGHVIYKGVHYWVQEFVGKPSSALSTLPLDGTKTMTIDVSSNNIKNITLLASINSVSLEYGDSVALPSVSANLTTYDFWSYTTDGIVIAPQVSYSVADSSVATILDGKLCGLKSGTTTLNCSAMGKTLEIPVTVCNHDSVKTVKENIVKGTCTTEGTYDSVIYCNDCGEELSRKAVKTPAAGHSWNSGKITKSATCTATGVKTYTCTVCKLTKTETIAKVAHTYKTVTTAATLTKDGKIQNKCSVCGNVKSTSTIAKIKTVTLSKTSATYTGKAIKPTVTVKDSKGKTVDSKYYTVTYKNNTNVGKATVTVKFKGNYSGSKTLTFKINPKATTVSKVTSTKKGTATVTVKKQATQTTGYEIQYSTSSKFTASTTKTVKITSAKTLSKTISKLTSGKTYYFRVRTYKTVSKVNYTSAWSKSVTAKIK